MIIRARVKGKTPILPQQVIHTATTATRTKLRRQHRPRWNSRSRTRASRWRASPSPWFV